MEDPGLLVKDPYPHHRHTLSGPLLLVHQVLVFIIIDCQNTSDDNGLIIFIQFRRGLR